MALKTSLAISGDSASAKAALRDVEKSLDDVGDAAKRSGDKLAKSATEVAGATGKQGDAVAGVAQQIGAFGAQAASSQDIVGAFGDQIGSAGESLSDMGGKAGKLGAFLTGPWGIAIEIAVAGLGLLIAEMYKGSEEAVALADELAKAASAADSFGAAQSLAGQIVDLTTGKLKTQNIVLVEYIKLAAQANIAAAQAKQREAADALKGQGRTTLFERATAGFAGIGPSYAARGDEVLRQLNAQARALKPLGAVIDGYSAAIDKVDLSKLTDLKPDQLESAAARIGTATTSAIAGLDKLAASGKLAGRDLVETKRAVLDLGKTLQDQIANQLVINAAGNKGVSDLIKPPPPVTRAPRTKAPGGGAGKATTTPDATGINDRIAGIEDQYSNLPVAIKRANDQLRELAKIKADIDKQPLLPGAAALKDRIEALGPAIQDSLVKPFEDYLKAQREAAAIDALLAQGREAEAAALQDVLQLQRQMGPLSEDQLAAVLATVEAERQRGAVLRDQQALIQANIDAVRSFRGALEDSVADALKGRFSLGRILESIGNSAINIASQRIVEQLFGSTLRSLEDQARGSNKVETAAISIASSLGKGGKAVEDFADVVRSVSDRLSSPGAVSPAANDNGAANDNEGDIVVTATRDRLAGQQAGQLASEQLVNIVERTLGDLGVKLPPVLGDVLKDVLGELEKALPEAIKGAAIGSTASRLVLGDRGKEAQVGSAIGGAAGQAIGNAILPGIGGPIGAIAGGILGGFLGGLFRKVPQGTASLSSTTSGGRSVSGNNADAKAAAGGLGDQVQQGLKQISEQLGGTLGKFAVSIGTFDGKFRVSTTGFTGSLDSKKAKGQGLVDFGKDGEAAAIAFAIADAIKDGAVQGLSAAVQQALKSSTNVNEALAEALKVADLETALGGIAAQLRNEFKALEGVAAERLRIARTYGFDIVKVEELNAKERLSLSEKLLKAQVGSLQTLVDNITSGSLFEGSAVEQRNILLGKVEAARADANAGVEGAADKLSQLLEQLNEASKQAFGTTGGFATDQQAILDTARDTIAQTNRRVNDAQKATDPALKETNARLNESNDQLAKIGTYLGVSTEYLKLIASGSAPANDYGALRAAAGYR